MKALTIRQPFCSLIAMGIKDIENRSWKTSYRGRILLHASKTRSFMPNPASIFTKEQWESLSECKKLDVISGSQFETGAIIGTAVISDIVENDSSIWALKDSKYHWKITHPVLFTNPIPYTKGQLRLWEMDMDKLAKEVANSVGMPYIWADIKLRISYGFNSPV